jgi:hypothetical protein
MRYRQQMQFGGDQQCTTPVEIGERHDQLAQQMKANKGSNEAFGPWRDVLRA